MKVKILAHSHQTRNSRMLNFFYVLRNYVFLDKQDEILAAIFYGISEFLLLYQVDLSHIFGMFLLELILFCFNKNYFNLFTNEL